jgi:membrane peptidoglycan carboxypeptidase
MQNSFPNHQDKNAPSARPWYKQPITIVVFLVLLIVSLAAGFAVRQGITKDKKSADQTTTLYYNDGKTVLWQTGQDLGQNADFIIYVQDQIKAKHGSDYQLKGTWKVTTSIDKSLQDTAFQELQTQKQTRQKLGIANLALVAQDVTNGQIVSWVSEREPNTKDPVRQKLLVGTLATPFTYMAYLDKNPGSATSATFDDSQQPLPGYICNDRSRDGNCLQNYDRKYLGKLTLAQALGGHRNVTAVSTAVNFGSSKVFDLATKMGSDGQCYLDKALTQKTACHSDALFGEGLYATPHRLLQAYATLANKGDKLPQTAIVQVSLNDKIEDQADARDIKTISPGTAQVITDILSDPTVSFLAEHRRQVFMSDGKKVAFVGGFTNDGKLSSTILFNDKYAVGVWGFSGQQLRGPVIQDAIIPQASAWIDATN